MATTLRRRSLGAAFRELWQSFEPLLVHQHTVEELPNSMMG